MRRQVHPQGVQARRTTEQLANAPPKKKGCRNPKRLLPNLLRATKRLLKAARLLLKTERLLNAGRLLNAPRLLNVPRLLNAPRLLNVAPLLKLARPPLLKPPMLPRGAAETIGIAAVPRAATAASAIIDLRIIACSLLRPWCLDALLLAHTAHPSSNWIRALLLNPSSPEEERAMSSRCLRARMQPIATAWSSRVQVPPAVSHRVTA